MKFVVLDLILDKQQKNYVAYIKIRKRRITHMRHGVLILLHNNYEQARKLLSFFDKEGNHIFLHIDKKSSFSDADKTLFLESACNAKVTFVDRVSVQWGGAIV